MNKEQKVLFNLLKLQNKFNLKINYIPKGVNLETLDIDIFKVSTGIEEFLGILKRKNIVLILGSKFNDVFKNLSEEQIEEGFKNIKLLDCPFIVYSQSFNFKLIEKYIKKHKIITFFSDTKTISIFENLNFYLINKKQEPLRVHGSMISVFGEGVMITGKSGIGKSEITLELINKGHLYIGDDAIDITNYADKLVCSSPKIARDFMEIRGIGIFNVKRTFGYKSILKRMELDLIIELVHLKDNIDKIDRLGHEIQYKEIRGKQIPYIQLPISVGRSSSQLIETFVNVFKEKKYDNYFALDEINKLFINNKNE